MPSDSNVVNAADEFRRTELPTEALDTDVANARRFAKRHGRDVRFTPEQGWLVYDGRRWALDQKEVNVQALAKDTAVSIFDEIKGAAERDERYKHAKRSQSKAAIDAMIGLTRSEPGVLARITDFDKDGMLLNVANGTVDLRTGKLRGHDRADLITNLADVQYEPGAACELWDRFLWQITAESDELYNYLRRLVGYLLVADVSEQALHFLFGTGANGKSVFVEVLMRLLGDYAIAMSADVVVARRHGGIPNDVARLRGVRVAFINETSQGSRFDEAKLKDLTGGDTLSARFLHQEFFQFEPTHRIVIRGNHKPTISGTDDGMWRRLRLVPFTVSIPTEAQDRRLLHKLESELPGILQWAIKGSLEWQRSGLNPPSIITEAVMHYREESDVLGRFIEEQCDQNRMLTVRSSHFYSSYKAFCDSAGDRAMPSKDLPGEMERRGYKWKKTKIGAVFEGLGIRLSSEKGDAW
jgi:putative DNA primase/helicase